jgi:prefoldin subunit 5
MDDSKNIAYIVRELADLRETVANLNRRIDEAERRPEEILQEIQQLWQGDPDSGGNEENE